MELKPYLIAIVRDGRVDVLLSTTEFICTILRGIVTALVQKNVIVETVQRFANIEVGNVQSDALSRRDPYYPQAVGL